MSRLQGFGSVRGLIASLVLCWGFAWSATPAYAACGDNVIDCTENCDDGNTASGDGCNNYCRIEYGFNCPTSSDPLSLSPIHHWALDESSGTAVDSIRTLDGSFSGATGGATGAIPASTGNAVRFDGVDDHISFPHNDDMRAAGGAVALWFRPDTLPTGSASMGLFSKDHTDLGTGGHLSVYLDKSSKRVTYRLQKPLNGLKGDGDTCLLDAECAGGTCASLQCTGGSQYVVGPVPTAGTWMHVAVTWGAAGMHLYVNGSSAGVNAFTGGTTGNFEPFVFGATTINSNVGVITPTTGFFDGLMDEVYVFDAQLDATDVAVLYGALTCSTPGGACTPGAFIGCGDGIWDTFREECEDGNNTAGDGCDPLCVIEHCGDGIINVSTEVCDDGNRKAGDGCDYNCLPETGYSCVGEPSVCTKTFNCGNMVVEPGELCDNATTCSADCKRILTCGDGVRDTAAGEGCDDYNVVAGDGCSATCQVEAGWACSEGSAVSYWIDPLYPSICKTVCGDNIIVGLETCDDGNVVSGDNCDERCRAETCGDGFVRGTEACDDGNVSNGDGCNDVCAAESGFVCPAANKAGKCVPETVCDPAAFYFRTEFTGYSSWACPFNATYDGNADGFPDCRTGKTISKYQNMKPFDVIAGDTRIALDAYSVSATTVSATIELAPAQSNGSLQPGGPWTVVATGAASGNGNTTVYDYDLSWTASANFSFAGGGLLMRITETSGTLNATMGYSDPRASYVYVDYDDAYPWDQYIVSWGLGLKIQTGTPVCGPLKYGDCADLGSGPVCVPPPKLFPDTTAWCGESGQNCEVYEQWSYGTSSRSQGDGSLCGTVRLYHYDYTCTSSGGCSGSSPSFPYLDRFCQHCDDSDPCTGTEFSSTSGCTYSSTGNTTCWDGDPAKQNIGACSNGINYCRNPGADCIGANYGGAETCDGVDNDCNSTIDDPAAADPTCDDGNPLTSDSCVAGSCNSVQLCLGTDASCGVSVPCADCTALSGWTATGNAGPCCSGLDSCICDEFELRTYYCSGTACDYLVEPVSPTYVTRGGTCATCDDSNICTTDSCNAGSGLCDNPDSGYGGSCYYGPAGTEGFGICAAGAEMCSGGVLGACSDVQPAVEACNNLDDDCNDIVDDGSADTSCPVGQDCWSGSCDDECLSNSDCNTTTEFCYFENGLLPGRCAPQPDACADVTCPMGATCRLGSCTNTNCGNDLDCNAYSRCYNSGRCLNEPPKKCNGVQCKQGEQCTKGTCAPPCNANADCASGNRCYDGFCFPDVDPCAGVDCKVSEICYQNECFEQCAVDSDCTDPGDVCYDSFRCGPEVDPCDGVICALGDFCYQGGCFPTCGITTDCLDMSDLCYDASRCAIDNCEDVQCPTGEACSGGVCYLTCATDVDCSVIGPFHQCWGGFCTLGPCQDVQCGTDQVCSGGVCYYQCVTDADCSIYSPGDLCYDGLCTTDPCAGVLCLADQSCYAGSCYDICLASPDCDPSVPICYDDFRCSIIDPCDGVACSSGDVCYQGACYEDCSVTLMCSNPNDICYDSLRCAPGPCSLIQCPSEEFCFGGSCFQACTMDADCTDPMDACYDGRCAMDICEGVQCGVGEVCYQGTCYQSCNGSIDCTDPSHVCYNNLCQDPCDTVTCGAAESCYLGTCYETCGTDADCSDPTAICYDNRCVDPIDPWCDGVVCPGGEACYRGTCYESCTSQADCSDPNSICYDNTCLPSNCGSTTCESNEVCYNGVCYEDCSDGTCDDPADICYDNMRCAASACEAQAQTFIDAYDSGHPFHTANARLRGEQLSVLPWLWPRPYRAATPTSFDAWADLATGNGVSSDNNALYARGSARVVIYYDETDSNSYKLYLIQGSKDATQGRAEATYSIRVQGVDPTVLLTDDRGGEGFTKSATVGGWTHIQAHVTTGASETGGVAIGTFPATGGWRIAIAANFGGDIQRWELMNGENGRPMGELSTAETFSLRTTALPSTEEIQPEFGSICPTGELGICERGTVTACTNWQLTCSQTVYPWNFEICDGVDNTCNGLTDQDDTSLQFGVAESRQSFETSWRPWPTIDSTQEVAAWLRYTPLDATDDRVGSTDAQRLNATALQDPRKVMLAILRNTNSGAFSVPVMVGHKTNNSTIVNEVSGALRAGWSLEGRNGTGIEEASVCWYDDRAPSTDEVLSVWDPTGQSVQWASYLANTSGTLESDTVVLRPQWLEGVHGRPTHLRLQRDISDAIARRYRRYAPYTFDLNLNPALGFHFRVSAKNPDESYCISDTATANGCRVGTYICTPTGIGCSTPDDDNCIAGCADLDQDGQISFDPIFCSLGTDCDDYDPNTYLGATEVCDGRDNDCDGNIDYQTLGTCSNGDAECGPDDCNGLPVCQCPGGVVEFYGDPVDTCTCGEGLAP